MSTLPYHPNLEHLCHQAKDLLSAAKAGTATLEKPTLSCAQLAVAREHGFPSWRRLKAEIERRTVLDSRDPLRLAAMIAEHPELAVEDMSNWSDHGTIAPLGYVALMRCVVGDDLWRDMPGSGELARQLIAAGALVDGHPGDRETPLITAASYGDAEVARVLIEAGASLERRSAPDAGGVPSAAALTHAAVFGMTDVLDLLVAAGARVDSVVLAAAAGDLTGWPVDEVSQGDRVLALIMTADHQRLEVIDALLQAGTPIDAEDETFGRQALRLAAEHGRATSVAHLLARGADPRHRDPAKDRTALYWCRRAAKKLQFPSGHAQVDEILSAALDRPALPTQSHDHGEHRRPVPARRRNLRCAHGDCFGPAGLQGAYNPGTAVDPTCSTLPTAHGASRTSWSTVAAAPARAQAGSAAATCTA